MKKYPTHLHCVTICCFFSYAALATAAEQNVQVNSTDYAAISKSTEAVNENLISQMHAMMKLVANDLKTHFKAAYNVYKRLDASRQDDQITQNFEYWNQRITVDISASVHRKGSLETLYHELLSLMLEECIPCYQFLMRTAERIPELKESISSMERGAMLKEVLIPVDKFLKLFNKKCFALPRALRKQLGKDDAQAAIARVLANESQNNQISGSNVTRKLIEQIVREGANAVGYSKLTAEDTASLQTVYGNIVLQIASKQQKDLAQQKKERRKQQKELERQEKKEKIKRKFAKIGLSSKTEKMHNKEKTSTPKSNAKRLAQSYEDSGTIIAPADVKNHKWKETIKKAKKKKSNDNE